MRSRRTYIVVGVAGLEGVRHLTVIVVLALELHAGIPEAQVAEGPVLMWAQKCGSECSSV